MIYRFLHIIAICLVAALLLSCERQHIGSSARNAEIMFHAMESETKGLIEGNKLCTEGTTLKIYGFVGDDYITNYDNDQMAGNNLVYDSGSSSWQVFDGSDLVYYYWILLGQYRFYGWLEYDAFSGLNNPLISSFDPLEHTLSVSGTLNKEYSQFDFLYSDVYTRTLNAHVSPDPVSLNMKHLFSAFSFGAKNTTDTPVTITGVTIEGLHDKGSADISFSGNASDVSYETEKGSHTFIQHANNITIPASSANSPAQWADIINGDQNNVRNFMVWPQKAAVLSPSNPTGNFNMDGTQIYESADSLIIIDYTLGGRNYKKRMKFPANDWMPGSHYHFDILFSDKIVELKSFVEPWTYISSDINYADKSVTYKTAGILTWKNCTVDDSNKTVTFLSGQPVEASFCFDTPTGGAWVISLDGDFSAFELEEDSGAINDGMGPIDGKMHTVKIRPKIVDPKKDYVVKMNIAVMTSDGEFISGNDIYGQKGQYSIVLKANN